MGEVVDCKIIAHRGASGLVDFDNSIESFKRAIEIGADMIEFDVRKTEDDRLVAFHDAEIKDKNLSNIKYEELLNLSRKDGYEVPLVEEVIQLCKGKIGLDIELKEESYEGEVVELVTTYLGYDEFVMKSFSDKTVKRIKSIDHKVDAGLLLGVEDPSNNIKTRFSELFPKKRLKKCRADFVSPNHRLLNLFFLKRMESFGGEVYVWTVNDVDLIEKLLRKEVDGIITDRPDLALKVRQELSESS